MGMIRVALALAVLFTHLPIAPFKVMGGGLAVQSFFIISGFYMALVLQGKYSDRALFYSNRLLRLLPTYFVMMAVCAVALFGFELSATASPQLFADAFAHPGAALVLGFENLAIVGQELLFWFRLDAHGISFDPTGALPTETSSVAWQALLVPQSWSLSMELMFYALAPYLVRASTRTLAALAGLSIGLRVAGHWLPVDYGIWQGRLFPTALFLFLLGMLAQRALPRVAQLPRWTGIAAATLTLAVIVALPRLHLPDELSRWLVYLFVAAVVPLAFSAFQHSSWDRTLGDLSYPIYLCHLLVVAWVLTYEPPYAAWVAIGATLGLAALLLVLVDRPVDRWRQARAAGSARSAVAPALPAMP